MEQEEVTKQTDLYAGFGMVHCSVCVPKAATDKQIETAVNILNIPGVKDKWTISKNATFSGGGPNPSQCQQLPNKQHFLMELVKFNRTIAEALTGDPDA